VQLRDSNRIRVTVIDSTWEHAFEPAALERCVADAINQTDWAYPLPPTAVAGSEPTPTDAVLSVTAEPSSAGPGPASGTLPGNHGLVLAARLLRPDGTVAAELPARSYPGSIAELAGSKSRTVATVAPRLRYLVCQPLVQRALSGRE